MTTPVLEPLRECGHLFKLVAVVGTSERWRCINYALERVDGPMSKCGRCGGYLCESRPWWCGNYARASDGGHQ